MATETTPSWHIYVRPRTIPFWLIHVIALVGVVVTGFSWAGLGLAVAAYFVRIFFVTAGYHRYFSHKTYKTSRFVQFLLAFCAQTTAQKGALWWAAHHRGHHRFADKPGDPHSPRLHGLAYAHVGWILDGRNDETEVDRIEDLTRYPELVWLNKYCHVPVVVFAVVLFLAGGWFALLWGFFVSTVMTWHGTFTINSLTHIFGQPRFKCRDDSKNSWLLAILTLGEGWHNNHHFFEGSARQGFLWWEYDITYYVLRLLGALGIVWDIKEPPARVLNRRKAGYRPGEKGAPIAVWL